MKTTIRIKFANGSEEYVVTEGSFQMLLQELAAARGAGTVNLLFFIGGFVIVNMAHVAGMFEVKEPSA